ncbi:MAG: carotenoid biosynthesis protein [Croceivirga sp.]
MNWIKKYRTPLGIFLVWLFHLSGLIGITVGHQEWFIQKTPLNLLVCALLFLWIYPMDTGKKWMVFGFVFITGMFAEWLGANHSLLFGSYDYGKNLGPKLDGVPFVIGINWALLTFISAEITSKFSKHIWFKALLGAALMVFLDFLMEQSAPVFDFWSFGKEVPLQNYITWYVLAYIFHLIFQKKRISGNYEFSLNLFLAQSTFFGYFMLFPLE